MRLAGSRGRNASLVSSRPPLRPFGSHSSGATTRRPTPGASYDPPRELERPTGRRGEASLSPGADDHYRTQLYLPLYLPDLLETAIMRRLNSARCCAQIRHGERVFVSEGVSVRLLSIPTEAFVDFERWSAKVERLF